MYCIIDFGFGFTGSTHDSTTWEKTHVFEEHETIFEEGEFIWANSAYPVCTLSVMFKSSLNSEIYSNQIQTWVVAPTNGLKVISLVMRCSTIESLSSVSAPNMQSAS